MVVTDIEVDITYSDGENNSKNIYVSAKSDDEYINDKEFYSSLEKYVSLYGENTEKAYTNIGLEYDPSLNSDKGGLITKLNASEIEDGAYTVTVTLKNNNLDKTVEAKEKLVIDSTKATTEEEELNETTTENDGYERDIEGNILFADTVKVQRKKSIVYDIEKKLVKQLSDEHITEIIGITGESGNSEVVKKSDNKLEIQGINKGNESYDVTFICDNGETYILTLTITTTANYTFILILIVSIVVLIALFIVFMLRKMAIVPGSIYIEINTNFSPLRLTWNSLRGKSFSLYKLLMVILERDPSPDAKDIKAEIQKLKKVLSKYRFVIALARDEQGMKEKTYKIKYNGMMYSIPTQVNAFNAESTSNIQYINIDFEKF